MKTIEKHRLTVRQIADLAFAKAIKSLDVSKLAKSSPKEWDDGVAENCTSSNELGLARSKVKS